MNRIKQLVITLAAVILLLLVFSQMVYASVDAGTFGQSAFAYYIDPGTGSIIIQVLIGALVGGVALIGVYRMRVKNFFTNVFSRRRHKEEGGETEETEESE